MHHSALLCCSLSSAAWGHHSLLGSLCAPRCLSTSEGPQSRAVMLKEKKANT